jgi:preprotein translocase subunit SecG
LFVAWVVFHVLVCVALVLVVLLQASKGEGLAGSAFGGGGLGGAVFGGRGAASFLSKATSYLAVVFMLNCGALAFMSSSARQGSSDGGEAATSTVTQQAQRELEQAMQQQQQQQLLDDSTAPVQLIPPDQMTPAPQDTTGQ